MHLCLQAAKNRYIFAMLIHQGHRFRLDLSEEQAHLCSRTAGTCRWLWNLALEQRILAWRHGRHSVGFAAPCAELPGLKVAAPWLAEAPSHCLQQTLRDLDLAFRNFFAGRAGFPAFRKKGQRDRFRFPDPKPFLVSLSFLAGSATGKGTASGRLKLPKLGWVVCRNGNGRQLEYKCPWYGSKLVARNPAYTSQQCSDCGHTDPGNRPSQAVFRCLACGHFDNADVNAAKNILARGTAEGPSVAVCGAMPSGGRRNRNLSA